MGGSTAANIDKYPARVNMAKPLDIDNSCFARAANNRETRLKFQTDILPVEREATESSAAGQVKFSRSTPCVFFSSSFFRLLASAISLLFLFLPRRTAAAATTFAASTRARKSE